VTLSNQAFEPTFLTLDEVIEIPEQQIEMYGGSHGLRDPGALECAVAVPQSTFGGEYLHPTIFMMAAAYLFHLVQNHAFIDGNKRIGANVAITFLYLNEWELCCTEDQLVDLVLSVTQGRLTKEEISTFFETHSCPDPQTI
jgi:death-on-curing protein